MLYKSCFLLLLANPVCFSVKVCEFQQSEIYAITWPETSNTTFSEPLCIGTNKEILYRKCQNGTWGLEPTCNYIQVAETPLCPEDFRELGNYCYQIIFNTTFPPQCPYPDLLSFEESVILLEGTDPNPTSTMPSFNYDSTKSVFLEVLWVPAVRNTEDGIDFVRWIEASENYGTELETELAEDIINKNCVVYENGNYQPTYCDEKHATLCVYNNILNMTDKNCSKMGQSDGFCFRYDMSSRTSCACLESNSSEAKLVEFQEIYQNKAVDQSVSCVFGLEKNLDGKFVWISSEEEINYTLWSSDVVFNDAFVYGKFSEQKWALTDNTEDECFINQREIKAAIATLNFVYGDNEELKLRVENVYWLESFKKHKIFCFGDSTDNVFIKELVFDTVTEETLAYPGALPGFFWCKAFHYSDSSIIKTKKLLYRQPTNFEFLATFRLAYPTTSANFVSSDLENYLRNNVLAFLNTQSTEFSFKSRLMKIIALDFEKNLIAVNIHFSITDRALNMSNAEEMFRCMENIVINNTAAAMIEIEMYDFLSSDYCMEETIDGFTFPTTELLSPALEVSSDPLCFNSEGDLIKLSCVGSFTYGATWFSNVSLENCTQLPSSYQTLKLLALLNSNHLELSDLLDLAADINTFFAVDIYLLVELMVKSEKDKSSFFTLIDAISEAERDVLVESYKVTRSTDNLLTVVSNYLKNYDESGFTFQSSNLAVVIYVNENVTGIAFECLDGKCNSLFLNSNNCDEDDLFTTYENLEFGVCFTERIQTSVAFTIFFKDSLFNQNPEFLSFRNIFGVHLIDENKFPVPIKILQKTVLTPTTGCFIYTTKSDFGWEDVSTYEEHKSFSTCTLMKSGFVAFAFNFSNLNPNGSVTDDLEDLINSDVADDLRITRLADISERFFEFQEKDMFLVGKILDTLRENIMDLKPLAKVVNNLHKVEKTVLVNSQKESKALDTILQNTDSMLIESKSFESFLSTENFIVVTSTNISGVVLLQNDGFFEVQVFRGNFSIEEISSFDNIISFVFLSSELKSQLPPNSKIIVTIFISDTLFYEESEDLQRSVSTIFGVILPEIGNYSGPIIIEHNISATNSEVMDCSHWNYGRFTESSFWEKDVDTAKSGNFLRCEFWHTTHFALLLLERNVYDDSVNFWITLISSVASLIGLSIIFLTGILFENWRRKIGNQILLNFSVAITSEILMFHIGSIFKNPSSFFCTLIGLLLQYSIMSQFCWTLIVAVIQFRRFVIVFASSPRNFLIKCCLCGWALPLIPVFYTLGLSNGTYTNANNGLCYPSGVGLYYGMWLPISAITFVNLIIFIYIVVCLLRANSKRTVPSTFDNKHQTRLFIMLFFLLGLTWCFGFLSFFKMGMAFSYAFNSTATLQGFILFLYYIVFNSNTRQMYLRCFKKVLFLKEM